MTLNFVRDVIPLERIVILLLLSFVYILIKKSSFLSILVLKEKSNYYCIWIHILSYEIEVKFRGKLN